MPYGVHMRNASGSGRGTWATYVQAARESAFMSKTELARRVKKDRGTIHRWETGQNVPEDAEVVRAVADLFGLDLDEALAAAGLRPGSTAPTAPTREPDEEMDLILAAQVDDRTKQMMIERLLDLRERDKRRRMEDMDFLLREQRRRRDTA